MVSPLVGEVARGEVDGVTAAANWRRTRAARPWWPSSEWVHDMIRRDLALIQQMAADTAAGEPAGTIRRGIRALASASPIWQLKAGCLRHCRFVHSHHSHESYLLFPALRQANPALNPVVDKLEADHQHVSTLLDEVEAATEDLATGTWPRGTWPKRTRSRRTRHGTGSSRRSAR